MIKRNLFGIAFLLASTLVLAGPSLADSERVQNAPLRISYNLILSKLYPKTDILSTEGDKVQIVDHSLITNGKEATFWTKKGLDLNEHFIEGVSETKYEILQDKDWLQVSAFDGNGDRIAVTVFNGRDTTIASYAKNQPVPFVEYLPDSKLTLEFYRPEYYLKRYFKILPELEGKLVKLADQYVDKATSPSFSVRFSKGDQNLLEMVEHGRTGGKSSIVFGDFVLVNGVELPQHVVREKANPGGLTEIRFDFSDIKYEPLDESQIKSARTEFTGLISSSRAAKGAFTMPPNYKAPVNQ